jgi:hypothetical protein
MQSVTGVGSGGFFSDRLMQPAMQPICPICRSTQSRMDTGGTGSVGSVTEAKTDARREIEGCGRQEKRGSHAFFFCLYPLSPAAICRDRAKRASFVWFKLVCLASRSRLVPHASNRRYGWYHVVVIRTSQTVVANMQRHTKPVSLTSNTLKSEVQRISRFLLRM